MIADVKEALLNSPDSICEVLNHFSYAHIKVRDKYISFGRDQQSSPKSIVLWLVNNPYLYIKDYPRNINKDMFSYIIDQRGVTFRDVITIVNQSLGITDYNSYFYKPKKAFGGFYNKVKKETVITPPKIYDRCILDAYKQVGNLRFVKDHIDLMTQRYFNIMFDTYNDGIVIPIYDEFGSLIGVKERVNHEIGEDEQKYWYPYPCQMSKTLYGYSHNYNFLTENTVLIFEAEKSVMQCHSYGIRNAVALGSGSISRNQIKMLHEIQPERVIFLHDVGYERESIIRNINAYKNFSRFSETEVGYWDFTKGRYKDKYSPSDFGKDELNRILKEEIVFV